jgi:hypothetical protein
MEIATAAGDGIETTVANAKTVTIRMKSEPCCHFRFSRLFNEEPSIQRDEKRRAPIAK